MYPNPEIFGISLSWYVLFHRAAVIMASLFFIGWYRYKKTFKLNLFKAITLIVFLVVISYSGSRLFAGLAYLAEGGTWAELMVLMKKTETGGYRWYGALITLLCCLPLFIKVFTLEKFARIFDVLGLTFCLFTVIVKLACLFSGDGCYGVITTLPWGMYFPYGPAPNILPVHPTPLYDSLFHLFAFAFLLRFISKAKFHGQIGLLYFLITSLFGFSLEFIRRNPDVFLGLDFAQLCYLPLFVIALILYRKSRKIEALQLPKRRTSLGLGFEGLRLVFRF